MPLPKTHSHHSLPRRTFLSGLLYASFATLLIACGDRSQPSEQLPSVTLDAFPTGLGRGFPQGTLLGADNSATGIAPGDTAPNFRIQFTDEQGLYLSDLQSHPVLINFWATWCGPCRLEMPEIVRHAKAHNDLIVLAINVQEELGPIEAFASDFNMTMPIVRDTDAEIHDLYQVRGMPTSIFIDAEGKVAIYKEGILSPEMLEESLAAIL